MKLLVWLQLFLCLLLNWLASCFKKWISAQIDKWWRQELEWDINWLTAKKVCSLTKSWRRSPCNVDCCSVRLWSASITCPPSTSCSLFSQRNMGTSHWYRKVVHCRWLWALRSGVVYQWRTYSSRTMVIHTSRLSFDIKQCRPLGLIYRWPSWPVCRPWYYHLSRSGTRLPAGLGVLSQNYEWDPSL